MPIDLNSVKKDDPQIKPTVSEVPTITGVNLTGATLDVPTVAPQAEPLSGIKMAGFQLAVITLGIMLIFIIFLIVFFFVKDLDASNALKAQLKPTETADKILSVISAEKKAYRDFVLEITKTILLNLLLPVLTAILGYIFGSSKSEK